MGTVQLNTNRFIDYRKDISFGKFLNLIDDAIYFENKKLLTLQEYNKSSSDSLERLRFNHLYAHHGLLEHLFIVNAIRRNMDFKSYKEAYISEFVKQSHPWIESHRVVINRMLNASKFKFKYFNYDNAELPDLITKSITRNNACVINTAHSMEGSNIFYNSLLVKGIIRGSDSKICGIICHDYSGDANSNYTNKNGNTVVYTDKVFEDLVENGREYLKNYFSVGILVEK